MDIKNMTLREKALQTAVYMINNETFLEEKVGGIYVGAAVFEHDDHLGLDKVRDLVERYHKNADIPLLVCSDFERGCGNITGLTFFPHLMGLGATNDEQLAYDYGKATAMEGMSIGTNWAFAPVCDLCFTGATHHHATERIVSDDEEYAIKMLKPVIKGMQDYGMSACSKHFPGASDDTRNPHITQTKISLTKEEWDKTSGRVFQELIDDGVLTVMLGHTAFPACQSKEECNEDGVYRPATLSKNLCIDLLKKEMGFKGIAVTDALDMGGVLGWYETVEETEIECIKAGCDMVLWPSKSYVDNLVKAVESGEVSMERLDDAVERILYVKEQMGLFEKAEKKEYTKPITEEEQAFVKNVATRTAENSITVVRDKCDLLPLSPDTHKKLAVVVITHYAPFLELGQFIVDEFRKRGFEADYVEKALSHAEMDQYDALIYPLLLQYGQPIGFEGFMNDEFFKVIMPNRYRKERSIVASFSDPHLGSKYFSMVPCYVNAYSITRASVEAFVKAVTGEIEPTDFSPVKINK